MKSIDLLINEFKNIGEISPQDRRSLLIQEMSKLNESSINCNNCEGNCCTFSSNSMQIDPLEAWEIIVYLSNNNRLTRELHQKLEKNIKTFRLDSIFWQGNKPIRKTYTCPFFENKKQGCTISIQSKPYGCLAFNPSSSSVARGTDCSSKKDILEKRNASFYDLEQQVINYLKNELGLSWDKLPIPLAILETWDKLRERESETFSLS